MTHLVTIQCSSFLSTSFVSFPLSLLGTSIPQNILRVRPLPALTIINILIISKINPCGCGSGAFSCPSPVIYPVPANVNLGDNEMGCLYRTLFYWHAIFFVQRESNGGKWDN